MLINYHRSNYTPDIFKMEELQKLFIHLKNHRRQVGAKWNYSNWAYLRDFTICYAMYDLAARPSEILKLKRCEIDFDNNKVMINSNSNHVHKGRIMYLSKDLKNILLLYLNDPYTKRLRRRTHEYMFPTCIHDFINIDSWKFRFAELLKECGIYRCPMRSTHGHLSSYSFRHTRAVHLYIQTHDIEFVANYLGHTTYTATMIYVQIARRLQGYDNYIMNIIELINRKQNDMIYKHISPHKNIQRRVTG